MILAFAALLFSQVSLLFMQAAAPVSSGETAAPVSKPDATLPPQGARVVATAEGAGVQIYTCQADAGQFHWVFQAPEATLFDLVKHEVVGTHGVGPTWTWTDGSAISGKLLAKTASTDPASIPWLLLAATSTGTSSGMLSTVSFVRRSATEAGAAPTDGCDAGNNGTLVRVPYQATYTFYAAPEKAQER